MSTRAKKSASKASEKRSSRKAASAPKKSASPPPFDGSVTHLIHRAEQRAGEIFARLAPGNLITPRQFAILMAIETDPGISQTGLVDKTGIDRSTLADIVRRMLDKGLVQRERTAEDARAYAVKLTRKGANMLKKMRPHAEEADKRIIGAIPKEDRAMFLAVLSQW
ncbi:MAG: winged helix-turn-helix transcriptional regulator [Rhodomicrobium sp.]|nr:winged helix-turn-helix transcriptional regulator [Rhodomicrobium sp.]